MSREAAMAALDTYKPVTIPTSPTEAVEQTEAGTHPVTQDSDRFASFARKEADLVKRQQAWKAEREQWEKNDKTRSDAVLKKAEEFESTRKSDPVAALKLLGFNEAEIINWLAAQEKKELTPEEKAAEIAAKTADDKFTAWEKAQQEKLEKEQLEKDNVALEGFKSGLSTYAEANKDKFPFCAHYGPAAIAQAYQNVLETVKESKGEDIPTIEEAIEEMEELYEYQFQEMTKLKTPKTEVTAAAETSKNEPARTRSVSAPGDLRAAPATAAPKRTLSNAAGATTAGVSAPRNESREQKRTRLAAQLAAMQRRG